MPTVPELYMLIRKCKWEEAEMNGKKGFLLTSIKNGNVVLCNYHTPTGGVASVSYEY